MLALRRFGARLADLKEEDFSTPGVIFQIGVVPNRIDILTVVDGVTFEEAGPRNRGWTGAFLLPLVPQVNLRLHAGYPLGDDSVPRRLRVRGEIIGVANGMRGMNRVQAM